MSSNRRSSIPAVLPTSTGRIGKPAAARNVMYNGQTLPSLAGLRLSKKSTSQGVEAFRQVLAANGGKIDERIINGEEDASAFALTGHGNLEAPYYEQLFSYSYRALLGMMHQVGEINEEMEQLDSQLPPSLAQKFEMLQQQVERLAAAHAAHQNDINIGSGSSSSSSDAQNALASIFGGGS